MERKSSLLLNAEADELEASLPAQRHAGDGSVSRAVTATASAIVRKRIKSGRYVRNEW